MCLLDSYVSHSVKTTYTVIVQDEVLFPTKQVLIFLFLTYEQQVEKTLPSDVCRMRTQISLFVLRFYCPVNPMGSCRARSFYLTTFTGQA